MSTVKEELERLRLERDQWQERATCARREATEHRRRKDFLAAIRADERAREYRANVKQWMDHISIMKGRKPRLSVACPHHTPPCRECQGEGYIERPYIAGVVNCFHKCEHCEGSGECNCTDCVNERAEREACGDLA